MILLLLRFSKMDTLLSICYVFMSSIPKNLQTLSLIQKIKRLWFFLHEVLLFFLLYISRYVVETNKMKLNFVPPFCGGVDRKTTNKVLPMKSSSAGEVPAKQKKRFGKVSTGQIF